MALYKKRNGVKNEDDEQNVVRSLYSKEKKTIRKVSKRKLMPLAKRIIRSRRLKS